MVRRKSIQMIRAENVVKAAALAKKRSPPVPVVVSAEKPSEQAQGLKTVLKEKVSSAREDKLLGLVPPRPESSSDTVDALLLHASGRLDEVYSELGIDGYALARNYRSQLRADGRFGETESLQYGEIDTYAFARLVVKEAKAAFGSIAPNTLHFVDIGAGTGKAVAAAALSGYFRTCSGFEIVPSLCQAAAQVTKLASHALGKASKPFNGTSDVTTYYRSCLADDPALAPAPAAGEAADLHLLGRDHLLQLWKQADVFFAPITCFEIEILHKAVREMNALLKPGALVITTSTMTRLDELSREIQELDGAKAAKKMFSFVEERRLKYGKGTMSFFIFRKR